jgi:hypothetical protein
MNAQLAQELMDEYAARSGILGDAQPRRYLWTDAYAVCNFLGLAHITNEDRYRQLALQLVQQVHHVLGRHREEDPRQGWISGLPDKQAEQHPTHGGLRIGKPLNERGPDEPLDSQLEWDRDGQYFHYLTKWIHALYRLGNETREHRYTRWAAELAVTAHRAFTYRWSQRLPKRMYWKMSIDLSRPLVTAMGQHDPLDGLVSCLELLTSAELKGEMIELLTTMTDEFLEIIAGAGWSTADPLGIGGLLDDATRLAHLIVERGVDRRKLLYDIMLDVELSLHGFCKTSLLSQPAEYRLPFRELGLSIGLHGLTKIKTLVAKDIELGTINERLLKFLPLAEHIETFWSHQDQRSSRSWKDHLDINEVMLAASLVPECV